VRGRPSRVGADASRCIALPCFREGGAYAGFDAAKDVITNDMLGVAVDDARRLGQRVVAAVNAAGIFVSPMKMEFEKVNMRLLLEAAKKYVTVMFGPEVGQFFTEEDGSLKLELLTVGLETVRRDSTAVVRDGMEGVFDLLLKRGAPNREIIEYARACLQRVLKGEVPVEDLVLSENLSKPLEAYVDKDGAPRNYCNVRVAHQLRAADHDVRAGDRVFYVYVGGRGKKPTDKAFAYEVYKAMEHPPPLDFVEYFKLMRGPFMRALQLVLTPRELRELFAVEAYERLLPAKGYGLQTELAAYISLNQTPYVRHAARAASVESGRAQTSIARFMRVDTDLVPPPAKKKAKKEPPLLLPGQTRLSFAPRAADSS